MNEMNYTDLLRTRITELRLKKDVSEHRMSLDLDKSGSYIRLITSGAALPSVKELFNIIAYLGVSPAEFFAPFKQFLSPKDDLCLRIQDMDENQISKLCALLAIID